MLGLMVRRPHQAIGNSLPGVLETSVSQLNRPLRGTIVLMGGSLLGFLKWFSIGVSRRVL